MRFFTLLCTFLLLISCETKKEGEVASFPTQFEASDSTQTATYGQVIDFYIELAREFPEVNLQTIGATDSGKPLHMVTFNPDADFNFQKIGQDKLVLLINNGIHPGESDGIDATMLLFRNLALKTINPPKNSILVSIPVYNVGGALNRNSTSRVNQNGPESYGFRGNARNYDLNRDFIKNDTKNAVTFARIFHTVKPDVFVDTHVSNGSDHQYTLTHLSSQQDKLGEPLGRYMKNSFLPMLTDSLLLDGWDLIPYVNVRHRPPDSGFTAFLDTPRYSTGYAALWNTMGMMIETHMLKPYGQRVKGTYDFLHNLLKIVDSDYKNIKEMKARNMDYFTSLQFYPLDWQVDSLNVGTLEFKGFQADTVTSEVTGLPRLRYNREIPYTKTITYLDNFVASDSVAVPKAYVFKKNWMGLIDFMERNSIEYTTFETDSSLMAEQYIITGYSTSSVPYEGHYLHFGTRVKKIRDTVRLEAGDYMIPTNQPGMRYLLETLEPSATDSFFNWNFFDAVLQRKEGFSPYVFEPIAKRLLMENDSLRMAFAAKKDSVAEFESDPYAQLEWIYEHSPYHEEAHLRYPVYRLP